MGAHGRRRWLVRMAGLVSAVLIAPRASLAGIFQRTAKPALEDGPFNAHYAPIKGTAQYARELRAAQKDLLGYLEAHFDLTDAQRRAVAALPKASILQLNAALERAVKEDLGLIIEGAKKGPCRNIKVSVESSRVVLQMLS